MNFCGNCGEQLAPGVNFCGKCGMQTSCYEVAGNQSTATSCSPIVGYWVCENLSSSDYAQLAGKGMKLVTHYSENGAGMVYYTDEQLVAHGNGNVFHQQPFTWAEEAPGRLVSTYIEGGVCETSCVTYSIQGQIMIYSYDDGISGTDRKLPDDFCIELYAETNGAYNVGSAVGEIASGAVEGLVEGFVDGLIRNLFDD